MKDRIKAIREEFGLTQQELADALSLKRNTIATYEIGKAVPSIRVVEDICKKYNVNKDWLISGQGEMRVPMSRSGEIIDFASKIIDDKDADFKRRLVLALSKMDAKQWDAIEKFINSINAKEQE